MKYVIYNLKWNGSIGEQPYLKVAEAGASLEGGVIVNNLDYMGYLSGSESQITAAVNNCADFNMTVKTAQEILDFWNGIIPKNTTRTTSEGFTIYAGDAYIGEDNRVKQNWYPNEQ